MDDIEPLADLRERIHAYTNDQWLMADMVFMDFHHGLKKATPMMEDEFLKVWSTTNYAPLKPPFETTIEGRRKLYRSIIPYIEKPSQAQSNVLSSRKILFIKRRDDHKNRLLTADLVPRRSSETILQYHQRLGELVPILSRIEEAQNARIDVDITAMDTDSEGSQRDDDSEQSLDYIALTAALQEIESLRLEVDATADAMDTDERIDNKIKMDFLHPLRGECVRRIRAEAPGLSGSSMSLVLALGYMFFQLKQPRVDWVPCTETISRMMTDLAVADKADLLKMFDDTTRALHLATDGGHRQNGNIHAMKVQKWNDDVPGPLDDGDGEPHITSLASVHVAFASAENCVETDRAILDEFHCKIANIKTCGSDHAKGALREAKKWGVCRHCDLHLLGLFDVKGMKAGWPGEVKEDVDIRQTKKHPLQLVFKVSYALEKRSKDNYEWIQKHRSQEMKATRRRIPHCPKPISTRWKYVKRALEWILKYWDELLAYAKEIHDELLLEKHTDRDIWAQIYAWMKNDDPTNPYDMKLAAMLIVDASNYLVQPEFVWTEKAGYFGWACGFRADELPLRIILRLQRAHRVADDPENAENHPDLEYDGLFTQRTRDRLAQLTAPARQVEVDRVKAFAKANIATMHEFSSTSWLSAPLVHGILFTPMFGPTLARALIQTCRPELLPAPAAPAIAAVTWESPLQDIVSALGSGVQVQGFGKTSTAAQIRQWWTKWGLDAIANAVLELSTRVVPIDFRLTAVRNDPVLRRLWEWGKDHTFSLLIHNLSVEAFFNLFNLYYQAGTAESTQRDLLMYVDNIVKTHRKSYERRNEKGDVIENVDKATIETILTFTAALASRRSASDMVDVRKISRAREGPATKRRHAEQQASEAAYHRQKATRTAIDAKKQEKPLTLDEKVEKNFGVSGVSELADTHCPLCNIKGHKTNRSGNCLANATNTTPEAVAFQHQERLQVLIATIKQVFARRR